MANAEYQQLVDFLGQRFTAFDGRFTVLEQRFAALEERTDRGFREVLDHFDEIYLRLERLEQEYYAITQALRRIETLLAGEVRRREVIERSVVALKEDVARLQARIEEIEQRLRR